MDLIIGVTGASGTIYAVKLLEALKKTESVTTHVIFSDYARVNLEIETGYAISCFNLQICNRRRPFLGGPQL